MNTDQISMRHWSVEDLIGQINNWESKSYIIRNQIHNIRNAMHDSNTNIHNLFLNPVWRRLREPLSVRKSSHGLFTRCYILCEYTMQIMMLLFPSEENLVGSCALPIPPSPKEITLYYLDTEIFRIMLNVESEVARKSSNFCKTM